MSGTTKLKAMHAIYNIIIDNSMIRITLTNYQHDILINIKQSHDSAGI